MTRRSSFVAGLMLSALAAAAQGPVPDTPAGHVLQSWLGAFNSGDAARIADYVKTTDHTQSAESLVGFEKMTGGFDLLSAESAGPTVVNFRVREKKSPTEAIGTIRVTAGEPPTVIAFTIQAIPPGATVDDPPLDAAARRRVIDGAIENLEKYYVEPAVADKMAEALRAHEKNGDYKDVTDGRTFADLLTRHLREVSHDKHLGVRYAPYKEPEHHGEGPSPEDVARFREEMQHENCTIEKVDVLDGNIGYFKFNAFPDPDICRENFAAAMRKLNDASAIIYDLRDNHGGDPKMVAVVVSYLFDRRTHINDMYSRLDGKTTPSWTEPVSGNRLADKPAWVLTSSGTFSGGEEFTYDLKNLKRATIVGETTGGGAHPVSGHRIDDHFGIGVPFGRPINPVSKKDWEGTGVTPDVPAKAGEALDVAERLARARVTKK